MKNIDEIIADQQKNLKDIQSRKEGEDRDKATREWSLKVASVLLQFLRNETLKVDNGKDYNEAFNKLETAIKSIPKTEKVSIQDLEKVVNGLADVKRAVAGIKFPELPETIIPDNKKELKAIEKAVKDIKFPEINIPEFPEIPGVDFAPLVKEIKALEKAVHDSRYSDDKKIEKEQIVVLREIESGLNKLAETLSREPEPQVDRTEEILAGLRDVSGSINSLVFPVPNVDTKGVITAIEHLKGVLEGTINVNIDMAAEGIATSSNQRPTGTGSNGAVTLSLANTAYSIPAVAPTNPYKLTVQNNSSAIIYIGYQNTNANGIALQLLADAEIELGANQVIYAYSATAGVALTYTTKES